MYIYLILFDNGMDWSHQPGLLFLVPDWCFTAKLCSPTRVVLWSRGGCAVHESLWCYIGCHQYLRTHFASCHCFRRPDQPQGCMEIWSMFAFSGVYVCVICALLSLCDIVCHYVHIRVKGSLVRRLPSYGPMSRAVLSSCHHYAIIMSSSLYMSSIMSSSC